MKTIDSAIDRVFEKVHTSYPDTPFEVEFWNGTRKTYGSGEKKFKLILKKKSAVGRIMTRGSLGFGEEFMKGNIAVEGSLQDLIKLGNSPAYSTLHFPFLGKFRLFYNYFASLGTLRNAKKNAGYHYDIGNDFYKLWLDGTLTYSCAYFKSKDETLEQAQLNKYDHLCRKLRLKAGETLVDIGCGWGGMMIHAAKKYGAVCAGYTLSENQYDYVREAVERENLNDSVKIYLKDYREASGRFDKFVSIGMFEHVGREFYPEFFEAVRRILKPGGAGVLHSIGTVEDRPTDPWVTTYIFPGGRIPTLANITDNMNKSGLVFYDVEDLRMHYAMTLDHWIANFEKNLGEVEKVMFDLTKDEEKVREFIRMWRLYLNGSSAGFKYGGSRLYQVTFSNGLNNELPLTRSYIYS